MTDQSGISLYNIAFWKEENRLAAGRLLAVLRRQCRMHKPEAFPITLEASLAKLGMGHCFRS